MTERASLVVTRNRAPPRRSKQAPDQPANEEISLSTAKEELARAIAELKELDQTMLQIDQDLNQTVDRLDDPSLDEWDRIEIEPTYDALIDRRSKASFDVLFATNRVIHFGTYLIGEWRETDLDNIARQLSQTDGLFARAHAEWPAVTEHPVWQRVYQEACPI
jgi:hypothetical protein